MAPHGLWVEAQSDAQGTHLLGGWVGGWVDGWVEGRGRAGGWNELLWIGNGWVGGRVGGWVGYLVLEELTERLNQLEFHTVGQATHVVVRLDGGGGA